MRRLFLALLILAPLVAAQPRRRASGPEIPPATLAPIAAKTLADGAPAISIAVARGDSIIFSAGYGTATANTIYQVGSVTKQFTAAAIMRLVERGSVALDDPIEKFLPEMAGRTITVRHLLTHTSGLVRDIPNLIDLHASITKPVAIARIAASASLFRAGTAWSYSNAGYYLLANIIERVSGKSYVQFLEDELLLPLGLASTGVCGSSPRVPTPDGFLLIQKTKSVIAIPAVDMSVLFGSGNICSTAIDLAHWSNALATGRVVSPASYEEMTREYAALSPTAGYGFGLFTDVDRGHVVVFHDGIVLGFQAMLMTYPDRDLTIAVLVNAIDDQITWVPATSAGFAIGKTLVPAK